MDAVGLPEFTAPDIGYGSAVIGVPELGCALLAFHSGRAVRCLRVEASGAVSVVRKVRGLLRDAVPDTAGRLWILTTHALQLVDLERGEAVATITKGLP